MIAIQLLARMHEQNMEIPLAALFTHPTLSELALAVGNIKPSIRPTQS
ncbi:phosphopantetheine-binding protein [Xenorhabdus hominickii]|nr:phosphopantetheine-binding protein [Xenorhabdus hominickii]